MTVKRKTLAQLFRDLHKIEAQMALLRLDLQAARILPKTNIDMGNAMADGAAEHTRKLIREGHYFVVGSQVTSCPIHTVPDAECKTCWLASSQSQRDVK